MTETLLERPQEAEDRARRWHERDADGESLRDRTLRGLRDGSGKVGPDLRGISAIGADLAGCDLSGHDLSGAQLSRADLRGTRLVRANLQGAVLHAARLEGAELLAADLTGADLSNAQAEGAGFGGANLSRAKLGQATLERATLVQARLVGADLRRARLVGARLREADLTDAELFGADLRQADLEHSRVPGASFVDADLREARLRGVAGHIEADWVGADVANVDFCGAYLLRRTIMDQNYLHEFRAQNRAAAVTYWVWWATSDCGRSFLRWLLWTVLLAVSFAGLYELVEIDYGDHRTPLSSLYYSVVTLTTLGYGDVLPASMAAQILAMVEVALGYVMLGGLLSIFSNKMARRAE